MLPWRVTHRQTPGKACGTPTMLQKWPPPQGLSPVHPRSEAIPERPSAQTPCPGLPSCRLGRELGRAWPWRARGAFRSQWPGSWARVRKLALASGVSHALPRPSCCGRHSGRQEEPWMGALTLP